MSIDWRMLPSSPIGGWANRYPGANTRAEYGFTALLVMPLNRTSISGMVHNGESLRSGSRHSRALRLEADCRRSCRGHSEGPVMGSLPDQSTGCRKARLWPVSLGKRRSWCSPLGQTHGSAHAPIATRRPTAAIQARASSTPRASSSYGATSFRHARSNASFAARMRALPPGSHRGRPHVSSQAVGPTVLPCQPGRLDEATDALDQIGLREARRLVGERRLDNRSGAPRGNCHTVDRAAFRPRGWISFLDERRPHRAVVTEPLEFLLSSTDRSECRALAELRRDRLATVAPRGCLRPSGRPLWPLRRSGPCPSGAV
jgi:hypothetical protein